MAKTKVQPEVSRAPSSNGTLKAKDSVLLDSLPSTLAGIFSQSQHSLTTHRKLVNQLHKLFIACCAVQETAPGARKGDDERIKLTGEKAFRDGVLEMLDRVVACKKGVVQADRVVKFVAAYCGFASEHGESGLRVLASLRQVHASGSTAQIPKLSRPARTSRRRQAGSSSGSQSTSLEALKPRTNLSAGDASNCSPTSLRACTRWSTSPFTFRLFRRLTRDGCSDDLFCELRDRLLIRARDKEAIVRQQAAIALMKFRPVDDQDEEDEDEEEVNETLIDLMIHDPAPYAELFL